MDRLAVVDAHGYDAFAALAVLEAHVMFSNLKSKTQPFDSKLLHKFGVPTVFDKFLPGG